MAFSPCHGRAEGGLAFEGDLDLRRADAPDLERPSRRLQNQGEVRVEYIWNLREDELEAVLRVWSLLPLVEDEGAQPRSLPTRSPLPARASRRLRPSCPRRRDRRPSRPRRAQADRPVAPAQYRGVRRRRDELSNRRVRPADDEVVRDAPRLPAGQPRHARLQVVAEGLLFARDARALEEPEQVLEQALKR